MIKEAYPLQWPSGWQRARSPKRSQFADHSIDAATSTLLDEIRRLNHMHNRYGKPDCIISTDLKLRNDGLPYSGQRQPQDQGVAVYFKFNNQDIVIACDNYTRIQDNIYAIAKTIEAMRAITRYGASDLLQRAFTGFQALPAGPAQRNWWEILFCQEDSPADSVKSYWRQLAKKYHPDNPDTGDEAKFKEVQFAWERCPHYQK